MQLSKAKQEREVVGGGGGIAPQLAENQFSVVIDFN